MVARRELFRQGSALGLLSACPLAFGQSADANTIRLVVGVSPGGTIDTVARQFAEVMARYAKRTVVVENATGAGGIIAAQNVIRAPGNGSALLVGFSTLTTLPLLQKGVPFNVQSDFRPIAILARTPLVMVTGMNGPSTLAELVARAKANPGKINFGSSEGTTRFAAQMLRAETGIEYTDIYYKGGAPLIAAAVAGEVDFVMTAAFAASAMVKGGRLKVIGALAQKRLPIFPDVPTFAEQGLKGYVFEPWLGLLGPASMSTGTADDLARFVSDVVKDPAFEKRIAELGGYALYADRPGFAKVIDEEVVALTAAAAKAGIKPE